MGGVSFAFPASQGWVFWCPGDERGPDVPDELREAALAWSASTGMSDAGQLLALGFWVPGGTVPDGTARFLRTAHEPQRTLVELREEWTERPELEGARVLAHGTYLLSEVGHVGELGDGVVESVTSAEDDGGPIVVSHRVVLPQDDGYGIVCEFDTFAAAVAEEFEMAVLHLVATLGWSRSM